ncbi:hypothetical protein BC937DRAFT_89913 [Endogone sp. FLAS-F59071]|nr:hypothetical protein BC937DRAFT_89913 [Endogone sp. FLAS-F59071]|eukprot:RUS17496.1 hypothetical protein BC937DRAFT_89913 [Endogone sp. FLAS-F59071]
MNEKPDKFNDLDADLSSQFNEKFGLEEESSTLSSNTHAPISHHGDQERDVSFLESNAMHAKTMTRSESSGAALITEIDHVAKEEEEQAVKQASNDPEFQQIITQFDPTVDEDKSQDGKHGLMCGAPDGLIPHMLVFWYLYMMYTPIYVVNSTLPETERINSNLLQAPERKSSDSSRSSQETAKPAEAQEIPFDFNRFLEQMRRRGAMPITRYFKSFLREFDRRPWTVNEQIKIVQDFLDFIYIKMHDCEVWRECTDQEFENAKEGMEKLVMNRIYQYTFSPNTTDDKERDEILHQKISIFRWVTEEHLDIPITSHNESFLSFAQSGMFCSDERGFDW